MASTLAGFLESVYLVENFGLCREYAAELRRVVRQLDRHHGSPITLADLSASLANGFLAARLTAGLSTVSVNNKRRELLTVWRAAADQGLAAAPNPSRITRLREPEESPTAWTVEEVARLLSSCRTSGSSGSVVGTIPAGLFWTSLIATCYWTGVRIGALMRARTADCDLARGVLTIRGATQKTHRAQVFALPAEAVAELAVIHDTRRELLWPWPYHRTRLFAQFRRLAEGAGLDCPKTGRQLFYRLRRTHISYCWVKSPELAQRQAGHTSAALTFRRYVSPMIVLPPTVAGVVPVPHFAG